MSPRGYPTPYKKMKSGHKAGIITLRVSLALNSHVTKEHV